VADRARGKSSGNYRREAKGIGLAIAQRFAQEGADVAFLLPLKQGGVPRYSGRTGNSEAGCERPAGFPCDVGHVCGRTEIHHGYGSAVFGKIDILVNNAGARTPRRFLGPPPKKDYDAVLNVNLKGLFFH